MPKRITKTDYSKYITQFDIDMAKSILHGMALTVDEGYGVLSMISLKEKDGFYFSSGDKRYLFSCKDDKVMTFTVEGESPFLDIDEYSKLLARKLRSSNYEDRLFIVLNIFNESVEEFSENSKVAWETINRVPDATYKWAIEEFYSLAADSPFPAKAFVLPPGFSYDGEELVNEYAEDEVDFSEIPVRDDDTFTQAEELLSDIIEYTHEGEHALRIVWDAPIEGYESYEINFSKKDKTSTMSVSDVMSDVLNRNIAVVNMNRRMDEGGKFQVQLISSTSSEDTEVKEVEIRGWDVTGRNILSMNETAIEKCIKSTPLETYSEAKHVYCDSWDYPISRVEVDNAISPVE